MAFVATRRAPATGLLGAAFVLFAAGAAAQTPKDSASMVRIAGGAYSLGTANGPASARPAHRVTLKPFLIDRHEVTNAQFVRFLNTLKVTIRRDLSPGRLRPADVAGPDARRLYEDRRRGNWAAFVALNDSDSRIGVRNGRFYVQPGYADHPVTESTWRGAVAYCRWRGARLPTEAEWEAAARGKDGRTYPWGETAPTRRHANFGRGRGRTAPVGTHPAGTTPEGVHDLAGNLAEWTSSLVRPYPYRADDGREDADVRGERITRGGDYVFDSDPRQLTGWFRDGFSRAPENGHRHIGFRCARSAA